MKMTLSRPSSFYLEKRKGSALIVVLWTVAILSIVVYSLLDMGRNELRIAKNYADSKQAYYLALAGIEQAKAEIYQEKLDRETQGENYNSTLDEDDSKFKEVRFGRGEFSLFYPDQEGFKATDRKFGIQAEEAKLNVNTASFDQFMRLPGMTMDIAAAIIDWRDEDSKVHERGGAEADFYLAIPTPYKIANKPFTSLRELLSVRGINERFLFGEDHNANNVLDPSEDDGEQSYPPDNQDGRLDRGIAQWLTTNSEVENVDARGKERVDIQGASAEELAELPNISIELAQAIVAYRSKNEYKTIGNLLDTTTVSEENERSNNNNNSNNGGNEGGELQPNQPPINFRGSQPNPNNNNSGGSGELLIDENLFIRISDRITVGTGRSRVGVIDINQADMMVLASVPGIDDETAESIVIYRKSRGGFRKIGELLDVPGVDAEIFKQVVNYLCVRPATYRIVSEGKLPATGVRRRVEVVVRMGLLDFDTIYYREDP